MKRRRFLKRISSAGLVLALGAGSARRKAFGESPAISTGGKSRIIVARRPGKLLVDGKPNPPEISDLLGRGIYALLDEKDSGAAWKKLFSPEDIVGIKINTLGGKGIANRPETVRAVCEALQTAGVPPPQIIVWDRLSQEMQRAGFEIVTEGDRPRCYGSDALGDRAYRRQTESSGSIGSCFSNILSKQCTALINMGVLKDHDLSGISIAMKNLFGVIHNPNRYHFDVHKDPYLPDLAMHPPLRQKLRLNIIDAVTAQYHNGPAYKAEYTWPFEGILLGLDLVAVDRVGWDVIEARRKEAGLPSLKESCRAPEFLQIAEEKGLGFADSAKIETIEVT